MFPPGHPPTKPLVSPLLHVVNRFQTGDHAYPNLVMHCPLSAIQTPNTLGRVHFLTDFAPEQRNRVTCTKNPIHLVAHVYGWLE